MKKVWPVAGAVLVLLEVCGAATTLLPLGGSHVTQLGIVFGLAFVVHEIMSVIR